ncbi:uncharacterized protein [Palaemon carinicauda]|uniref:uncharacterized protein n=1 Tax=Palaemon carinicauda TaxID=392227 RepID=UPI0035B65ACF
MGGAWSFARLVGVLEGRALGTDKGSIFVYKRKDSAAPPRSRLTPLDLGIMRTLVALVLAVSCSAQIAVPYLAAPYPWAIKYQGVDGFGQTTFGHQAIDQTRHEVRLADGSVVGQYSYVDAKGEPAVTYYVAGRQGFNVVGSNVLPEGPSPDFVPEYSEDVALARAQFFEAFEAARKGETIPQDVPAPVEVAAPEPTLTAGQPEEEEPVPAAEPEPEVVAEEDKPALSIAEEPAAEEESSHTARRARSVTRIPLPYLAAVPTETKTTIETKQFEPVDAPTPAATKKIELTTKEHVFKVPGFKYVQPSVEVKPVQYSLLTPQVAPFAPFLYPGFGYPFAGVVAASPKEE